MIRRTLWGIQLQGNVNDWPALYQDSGVLTFKTIMAFERCAELSREVITVARQDIRHQGYYLERCDTWEGALAAAQEYILVFRDSAIILGDAVDYWESLNETYAPPSPDHGDQTTIWASNFDSAFALLLPQLVPGAKPLVMTAGVGNPEPAYMDLFIDCGLMDHTVAAGGAFGIHSYWQCWMKQTPWSHPDWKQNPDILRYYSMRWDMMDEVFRSRGYYVKWLLTEGGAIGVKGGNPTDLSPDDGWRHPSVYNTDREAYIADIDYYDQLLVNTVAYNESRLLGWHIFVATDAAQWPYFRLNEEDLVALRSHAVSLPPLPDPYPEPPPPPPPPNPTPYVPVAYSQRDPRWKDELLGFSTTYTIGSAGCALTSAAMIAAVIDEEIDPKVLNEKMKAVFGFSGALIIWEKLEEAVSGIEWGGATRWYDIPADLNVVAAELAEYPTILAVDFYPGGDWQSHFVVALSFTEDGNDLNIIDPWDGATTRLLLRYGSAGWDLARAIYGIYRVRAVDIPEPPPEPCWCWPRVQYDRTVWLPYPDVHTSIREDIYKEASRLGITCTMSPDDAGGGGCEKNAVVGWNFPASAREVYQAWFATHYPHTTLEFKDWTGVDKWAGLRRMLGL